MSEKGSIQVLTFAKRGDAAHVVTDGVNVRSYKRTECKAHPTLKRAICYLEGQGFQIVMDEFSEATGWLIKSL